ncbi:MAG: hypothetical protein DRI61_17645 [Chloroflexi bacterium]|nr:MAG: hypothetical protein DRI61_17645 [Chloroflexota bacterium]
MQKVKAFFNPPPQDFYECLEKLSCLSPQEKEELRQYKERLDKLGQIYSEWLKLIRRVGVPLILSWALIFLSGFVRLALNSSSTATITILVFLILFSFAIFYVLYILSVRTERSREIAILVKGVVRILECLDGDEKEVFARNLETKDLLYALDFYQSHLKVAKSTWISSMDSRKIKKVHQDKWQSLIERIEEYREWSRSAISTTLYDLRREFITHLFAYLSGRVGVLFRDTQVSYSLPLPLLLAIGLVTAFGGVFYGWYKVLKDTPYAILVSFIMLGLFITPLLSPDPLGELYNLHETRIAP